MEGLNPYVYYYGLVFNSCKQFSNNSPIGLFQLGLKARNPLSPLLFILMMEVLRKMLSWMEGMEYISGFNAGNGFDNGFKISPVVC